MLYEQIIKIKEKAIENHVPIVRDKTIENIVEIIKRKNSKKILEIGTAVGYSGIVMLANSEASLTTIEKNENRFQEAKSNFEICNLLGRANLILGDAIYELQNLTKAGEKFDFIFLDGPKGQYIKYFPYLKELLSDGGILFADNILMGGLLEDESRVNHKNRAMVKNMRSFLEVLQKDSNFNTMLYRVDDGYTVSELRY